ncbi:MAG: hypothetical protein AAF602_31235 [Myxococcota bacterium]
MRLITVALPLVIVACDSGDTRDTGSDTTEDRYAMLELHDGYWVAELQVEGLPAPITAINDTFVDPETRRVTVYAQNLMMGEIMAPVQVGPGECTTGQTGEPLCYHPNAVYLNGNGREYVTDIGGGSWWVKHSWIVDGEGYHNCPLSVQESYTCNWGTGTLMDDDLTLYMSTEESGGDLYNIRGPILDTDPITYELTRYGPEGLDPATGQHSGGEVQPLFVAEFDCTDEVSEFDGLARGCP